MMQVESAARRCGLDLCAALARRRGLGAEQDDGRAHRYGDRRVRRRASRASPSTIASPALIGGARSTTSDRQGCFRFPEIAPGIYDRLRLARGLPAGARRRRDARGRRRPRTCRSSATSPTITETLVVTADAANVDTASSRDQHSASTTTYLQNLPTGRFQPDVLNFAPGINHERRLRLVGAPGSPTSSTASTPRTPRAAPPGRSSTTTSSRRCSSSASAPRPSTAASPAWSSTASPSPAATTFKGCSRPTTPTTPVRQLLRRASSGD